VAKQQVEAAKDAGKAAQAADATANAAAEAAQRGASVEGVVNAANIVVNAYELVRNSASARAARAVANAAGAKAGEATSSPHDVADAARTWADAIKAAEGQPVASKASDATPAAQPRSDLPSDLPPASAKVAFENALSIGTNPAMSAAGDYEYSMFATTPVRLEKDLPLEDDPPHFSRRIGFFAVKYDTPVSSSLAERYARLAAWHGAHAVQSQLVSLANHGLGHSVLLRKNESLIIGFSSFDDGGILPEYDWFAFERYDRSSAKWRVYTFSPADLADPQGRDVVLDAWISLFTDAPVVLGRNVHRLETYPFSTLLHEHETWRADVRWPYSYQPSPKERMVVSMMAGAGSRAALDSRYQLLPTFRVVISGDVVTFSIEAGIQVYDSFHLTGGYHPYDFPPAERGSRSAPDEPLQYGAIRLRSAAPPEWVTLERAAAYGADVLRRRKETLTSPDELRKERLGDNNHLVLFVRNARTGATSWLGVSPDPAKGLKVRTKLDQPNQGAQPQALDYPALPSSPSLVPFKTPQGDPGSVYPLFLGGVAGSRLVEVWILQNQRTEGRFNATPKETPLFDVQYLFLQPQ
jgi:hypothetical protein